MCFTVAKAPGDARIGQSRIGQNRIGQKVAAHPEQQHGHVAKQLANAPRKQELLRSR
ncbi:hypothetical protein OSTOST_06043 [Ostertagia ostertagi]